MSRPVERVSVGLVGCAASKAETARPARELYISDLFRKASAYAEARYDHWRIMSAQHYLVHPAEVIEPYDRRVDRMRKPERDHWAAMVELGLRCGHNYATEGRVSWPRRDYPELLLGRWIDEGRELGIDRRVDLWFHAGAGYVDPVRALLAGAMRDVPYDVHAPLAHMGIGQQLGWYRRQAQPALFLGVSRGECHRLQHVRHRPGVDPRRVRQVVRRAQRGHHQLAVHDRGQREHRPAVEQRLGGGAHQFSSASEATGRPASAAWRPRAWS
jgi:hypothetical protein